MDEIRKTANMQKINNFSKKIISPSVEEIEKHKEFIKKNLKRNFF